MSVMKSTTKQWSPARLRAALALQEPRWSLSRLLYTVEADGAGEVPSLSAAYVSWYSDGGTGPEDSNTVRMVARALGVKPDDLLI